MIAATRGPDARADRLPREGDSIGGKYRVDGLLGIGGMGAVVEATHVELGQRVAIKVMLPHLVERAEYATRFLREGRAAATLQSQHVARIFDVGKLVDGAPYLVMELLEGEDLESLVGTQGPLPIDVAVGYVLEACDALAEAHALGIVHRDLKPSNLFRVYRAGGAPLIKVLDFGVSKITRLDANDPETAGLTHTETMLGSPQYISPEQLRDARSVDARTDIWALGLVLHFLITARLAFEARSIGGHLAMVAADPPTPLRRMLPDAPAELEAIILRCLQKRRELRFQNAGQLALALAPFAPPWASAVLQGIVARVGEEVASAPLVALDDPAFQSSPAAGLPFLPFVPGPSTHTSWTPANAPPKPRRGTSVALGAAGFVAVLAIGLSVHRLLAEPVAAGPAPAPSATETAGGAATAALAPPAPAPPAPAPAKVAIRLMIEPQGATVAVDGVPTRDNPIYLPRSDRVSTFVVSAPGYETESREVRPQADAELTLALAPQPRGRPPIRPATTRPGRKLKGPLETDL